MFTWNETSLKLKLNFEDGLKDARRSAVDSLAYQINGEYRKGVDIAYQLMATLYSAQSGVLDRTMQQTNMIQDASDIRRW